MNEVYVLTDEGIPGSEEIRSDTLTGLIPYIDNQVRDDVPEYYGMCDEVIGFLQRERFDLAERALRQNFPVLLLRIHVDIEEDN